MMYLRPFEDRDAEVIASWIKNEKAFRQWSADRYERYPIAPQDIAAQYAGHEASDTLFPVTAEDESGVVGHMILRYPDETRKTIRFGFVIVDDTRRGQGLGKLMLRLAIRYAFDAFHAEKITLGVFENNPAARYCYEAVGFREVPMVEEEYYCVMGQRWKCLEMALEADGWN